MAGIAPQPRPVYIADTVVRVDGDRATVDTLHMRAGYQGAGMRARSMLALKEWARLREQGPLELDFSSAASVAARSLEFDRDVSDRRRETAAPGDLRS